MYVYSAYIMPIRWKRSLVLSSESIFLFCQYNLTDFLSIIINTGCLYKWYKKVSRTPKEFQKLILKEKKKEEITYNGEEIAISVLKFNLKMT